jgi:septal ring factor EnvC (AmiA/AmiB activator)
MKKDTVHSLLKILIILSFISSTSLLYPSDVMSNPKHATNQDKIKEIESRLSKEKQKHKTISFQEKDILAHLSELEKEVAEKKQTIEELRKKIRISKIEIGKLEDRLANLWKLLRDAETRMAKRLVVLYKYVRRGYFRILANVNDLSQLWQRAKYLKAIMEQDQRMLSKLADEESGYRKEITQIKEHLVEEEIKNKEEEKRLISMRQYLEKRVIRLMKTHKEKKFYEKAINELQLAALKLRKTLLNIEKKEIYNISRSARFADYKGKLPFPLEGKVISGNKFLDSKRQDFNKGIFIEGSSDNEIKAVFPGRVDFSGRLRGYGDIIIINHGSRYFTITAHLSQRKKEEGDLVEAGEVIGLATQNGVSKVSRVYFEIRKEGNNLAPLGWLKTR